MFTYLYMHELLGFHYIVTESHTYNLRKFYGIFAGKGSRLVVAFDDVGDFIFRMRTPSLWLS